MTKHTWEPAWDLFNTNQCTSCGALVDADDLIIYNPGHCGDREVTRAGLARLELWENRHVFEKFDGKTATCINCGAEKPYRFSLKLCPAKVGAEFKSDFGNEVDLPGVSPNHAS